MTSQDRDLSIKPGIYAPAVDEYSVVDLERGRIVMHRDAVGAAYATVSEVLPGEQPEPVAVTIGPLVLVELFAAAHPPLL